LWSPVLPGESAWPSVKRSPMSAAFIASSGQGRQGFIYTPHYAASKFGIIWLSQSLAKELASDYIRVNC
jgi:meso-butanediol dehydrogenase/(S,S)-butanediol dehydrogenase/diacetyl reductase